MCLEAMHYNALLRYSEYPIIRLTKSALMKHWQTSQYLLDPRSRAAGHRTKERFPKEYNQQYSTQLKRGKTKLSTKMDFHLRCFPAFFTLSISMESSKIPNFLTCVMINLITESDLLLKANNEYWNNEFKSVNSLHSRTWRHLAVFHSLSQLHQQNSQIYWLM